jgi:hypothetical protein
MHEACYIPIQRWHVLFWYVQFQSLSPIIPAGVSEPSLRFALDLTQSGPGISPLRLEAREIQSNGIILLKTEFGVCGVLEDGQRMLLLCDRIVDSWTGVEASAWR